MHVDSQKQKLVAGETDIAILKTLLFINKIKMNDWSKQTS